MAKTLQSNFAAGELSRRIRASGDLERYASGLQTARNLTILPLGGAERRSGSIWVEDPKDSAADAKLLPFVREIGADVIAIVINGGKLRFIDALAQAYVESGGSPVEITCTWTAADYPYLFSWQSADVVWICDRRGTAPVKVLKRTSAGWQALANLTLKNGPFLADESVTLTVSGVLGTINLTASGAVFTADHVGALINLRENTGAPGVKRWLSGDATIGAGDYRYNAGRVYQASSGGPPTGTNSPIHDEGTVSDGEVDFAFVHDGLGVAQIATYVDSTHATATVLAQMPITASLPATSPYWGFGAFSNDAGWPRAGCVHQERFVLGGAPSTPDTTYLSRVEGYGPDFADFKAGLGTGLVVDSDAVRRAINSQTLQQVLHYVSFGPLYVFTAEGVFTFQGPSANEPITPAGASALERCAFGADALVAPVKTGDAILYVTSGGGELREIQRDTSETPNASVLADHISGRGFAELAFQRSPYPVCWARLGDGALASMTYERLERVRAWAQSALGGDGAVTSAITLPGAGGREDLWCVVKRTVSGAARYAIEVIPPPWSQYRDPWEEACALDGAGWFDLYNTNGANRAKLTVLDDDLRAAKVETELNSFSAADVGRRVCLRLAAPANGFDPGEDAKLARVDVLEYVDAKTVKGRIVTDGCDGLAGAWTVHWAKMATTLSGLGRLNGHVVDVFGDGAAQRGFTVAGGAVTLSEPVARGWVGLPCPFEVVDLPLAQGGYGTAFGGQKKIDKAWVIAEYATPGAVVFDPANYGADTELVLRAAGDATDRPATITDGYVAAVPHGAWSETGQIGIRQENPFPILVLGIVKDVAA